MAAILFILIIRKNFKLPPPPKFGSPFFPSVNRNGISASAIMEKLKNGCHFINIDHTEIFQITDPPPKVWVSGFPSVNRNGISAWLHLKHLCLDIYASLVYPTSHLCVVLHFLIFEESLSCTVFITTSLTILHYFLSYKDTNIIPDDNK